MRTLALLFLLALPVAAQTTRITTGDNWVVPTVIQDASGSGNNGTNINAVTSVVGTNGRALSFGSGQYVTIPPASVLDVSTNEFSISTWLNMTSLPITGQQAWLVWKGTRSGASPGYALELVNSSGVYQVNMPKFGVANQLVNWSGTPELGTWYHLTGVQTYSNARPAAVRVYLNGSLLGSLNHTNAYLGNTTTNSAFIGNASTYSNTVFNGSLDDVRIYNRALSSNEVVDVYSGNAPTNGLVGYWPLDDGSYQSGLVGWWPMEDNGSTTPDRSGNGNTGTLTASPTTVPGKVGNALRFNGTSQYVTIGSSSAHNFASNQHFSVSLWVSSTAAPVTNTYPMLVNKEVLSPSRQGWEILLTSSTDNGAFSIYSGNTYRGGLLFNNFRDGKWHHLVCVRDSAGIYSYIDGLLQNQLALAPFDVSSTSATVLMRQSVSAGNYANGSLDDVRIYNRALSASEISSLYNSRRTFYGGN